MASMMEPLAISISHDEGGVWGGGRFKMLGAGKQVDVGEASLLWTSSFLALGEVVSPAQWMDQAWITRLKAISVSFEVKQFARASIYGEDFHSKAWGMARTRESLYALVSLPSMIGGVKVWATYLAHAVRFLLFTSTDGAETPNQQ